jgi:hypothetical protein
MEEVRVSTDVSTETSTDTSTAERAKETASSAADESRHVAGVAAGEAKGVASEAVQQARSVVGDAMGEVRGQLDDQGRQQKDRLAGTLSTFSDDLGRMAEGGSGLAADVAHEVADRVRSVSQHLGQRDPGELLDDVRRFARQRPGTFLLGALAAGVVVGRLVRGTTDAVAASQAGGGSQAPAPVTPPVTPRVTPGAPDTSDVRASHGQPTQSPDLATPPIPPPPSTPPSATGYSSPPPGTGLPETPGAPGGPA